MSGTRGHVPFGRALIAAVLVLSMATGVAFAGRRNRARSVPTVDLESPLYAAIVVDGNTGYVLHEEKADEPRRPASLTKVMTLYLLFQALEEGTLSLDTPLPVSAHAASMEPTNLKLEAGQTLTVQECILGLVTHSANDAAVVVAEAIAGTEPEFAERMTAKARELKMTNTVYRNASGLPDENQFTTARDQARLGYAIQRRFPDQYAYFSTPSFEFRGRKLKNHNKLLGKLDGMDGIKTGYIRTSKFNLLASVRRDDKHLVAVVLGGPTARSRDARMRELVEKSMVVAKAKPSDGHKRVGE